MHDCTAEGDSAANALGEKGRELEEVKAELGRLKAEQGHCETQTAPLQQKLQQTTAQL